MPVDDAIGRHLRVAVPPGFGLSDVDGLDAVDEPEAEDHLRTDLWDTEARTLAAWGHLLLAHRSVDGTARGWTLELAPGPGAGAVHRVLGLAEPTQTPPRPAVDVVRSLIGRQRLVRIASVDTVRRRHRIRHLASGVTVGIDDDAVTPSVAGAATASFRSITVEVPDAAVGLIDELARSLRRAGAGRLDPLQSMLRELNGPTPVRPFGAGVVRPRRAGDLVASAIAVGTGQLLLCDPLLRLDGDPESVHRARVATRRLRSDLKTLGDLLDPFRVEGLRRELAWFGRVLGAVRTCDVAASTLDHHAQRIVGIDPGSVEVLQRRLDHERSLSCAVLRDVMRSGRYQGLVADLIRLTDEPPLRSGRVAVLPAKRVGRAVATAAFAVLERDVRRLSAEPAIAELHELRKTAKRARYAAELVAPLAKGRTMQLARALADLQDRLGEHVDDADLLTWLEALPLGELDGVVAFDAGRVAERLSRSATGSSGRWHGAWRAAKKAKDRSRLA
jgi:CHAD domain-containing protein